MLIPRKEELADGVTLYLGDCLAVLPTLGKVDAVVTSPPYDDLRAYGASATGPTECVPAIAATIAEAVQRSGCVSGLSGEGTLARWASLPRMWRHQPCLAHHHPAGPIHLSRLRQAVLGYGRNADA